MYEVVERFDGFAALKLHPKTGRTHQIRVHMDAIHHPVLCDKLYGGRSQITRGELRKKHTSTEPSDQQIILNRQALHAHNISLRILMINAKWSLQLHCLLIWSIR